MMMVLSVNSLSAIKILIPSNPTTINPSINPRFLPISASSSTLNRHCSIRFAVSASSAAFGIDLHVKTAPQSISDWGEFARRVSGEWDGFGADFTTEGSPILLPENVVPEAFREWEVEVFDWQTQSPTLAAETGDFWFSSKLIRLLPTVGCEADAATRHSVEERIAGGEDNMAYAFGYDPSGRYVAVWPVVVGRNGRRLLELEHCLVDPGNQEARVRVVQVVRVEEDAMRLERIKVFSEQRYGPYRNGEQLGGCAIRESGFATTGVVNEDEVVGVWRGMSTAVATFGSEPTGIFCEFETSMPKRSIRDRGGLVTLPKQLWCSLKENKDGEIWGEVGWLVGHRRAMTSRCIFQKDGKLKDIAIGHEAAALDVL